MSVVRLVVVQRHTKSGVSAQAEVHRFFPVVLYFVINDHVFVAQSVGNPKIKFIRKAFQGFLIPAHP